MGSIILSANGCLKAPDFQTGSASMEPDQEITEPDSELTGGEVLEEDAGVLPTDASLPCESLPSSNDASCLDESLPMPDQSMSCEATDGPCPDAEVEVEDMEVPEPEEFTNTRWLKIGGPSFLQADGSLVSSSLGRLTNGSGEGDAWTISIYVKTGNTAGKQSILYYGSGQQSQAHLGVYWSGKANNDLRRLILVYGTDANHLEFFTPPNTIEQSSRQWYHLLLTYDGYRTGSQADGIDRYLSRFKIFIDGNQQVLETSHSNYGIDTELQGTQLVVGIHPTEDFDLSGFKVDELAIWESDQSVNVMDIYNDGQPHDLKQLTVSPSHWWRFGDGEMDEYPILRDQVGEADFTMHNMSYDDIVDSTEF